MQSRIHHETLKDIANNSIVQVIALWNMLRFHPRILLVFATMVIKEFNYRLGHAYL